MTDKKSPSETKSSCCSPSEGRREVLKAGIATAAGIGAMAAAKTAEATTGQCSTCGCSGQIASMSLQVDSSGRLFGTLILQDTPTRIAFQTTQVPPALRGSDVTEFGIDSGWAVETF